jgi:hypothetical protein
MGVPDDRYTRDLRRYNLALRMLRLGARPNTIRTWTGFSRQRVRVLIRSQRRDGTIPVAGVLRGPSPTSLAALVADAGLRSELTAMAGWCRMLGVLPMQPLPNARLRLPSVRTGERLCQALDEFRTMVPHARITFEQLLLLVFELAEGDEWSTDHCRHCGTIILVDRLSVGHRVCADCRQDASLLSPRRDGATVPPASGADGDPGGSPGLQQSLF